MELSVVFGLVWRKIKQRIKCSSFFELAEMIRQKKIENKWGPNKIYDTKKEKKKQRNKKGRKQKSTHYML